MERSPGDSDRPCLWMSAGLIAYRLCDRDFDCDGCPLDAALRGHDDQPASAPVALAGRAPVTFPPDRRYSAGHLWLREEVDGGLRWGLDALAAALLGPARAARVPVEAVLAGGEPLCELEVAGGTVVLGAPFACRVLAMNPGLRDDPDLATREPYGKGWIAGLAAAATPELLDAEAATHQGTLDLRHLRRRIALDLLSEPDLGPTLADGGVVVTDVRRMLGDRRFLALVRELVH